MTYSFNSGDPGPPKYEKQRALRMARKLGLRIISSGRAQASSGAKEPLHDQEDVPQNRTARQPSGPRFAGPFKLPTTS